MTLYGGVRKKRREYESNPIFYKNRKCRLITNVEEALKRWRQYFEQLLNRSCTDVEDCEREKEKQLEVYEVELRTIQEIKRYFQQTN